MTETKFGWSLDIDNDCAAEFAASSCPSVWEPTKDVYGVDGFVRFSRQMPENNKCIILIDAT